MSIPVSIDPLGTLGASHEPPPGYTSLAAIRFTPYEPAQIDIGLAFDLDMVWSTKMAIKNRKAGYAFHGAYDPGHAVHIGARPDGLCAYMGLSDSDLPFDTEAHEYVVDGPGRIGSVDGVITQHDLAEGFSPSSARLFIGGRNSNIDTYVEASNGDVYWTRVSRGGVLLADCVPVLDPNGIACLFDRARGAAIYSITGTPPAPVFEP